MILTIAIAVWSPIVGSLLDRVSAAGIMCVGGLMLGVGLCTIANASSLLWVCAAIGGPLALGIACAGPLAASTVVARWFRRRRGARDGVGRRVDRDGRLHHDAGRGLSDPELRLARGTSDDRQSQELSSSAWWLSSLFGRARPRPSCEPVASWTMQVTPSRIRARRRVGRPPSSSERQISG